MEFHQVRYFIALCNTLNFTRAAEACNVSQPALTRAIQRLEEELGGPLFQRERNLTQLTELGRLMRPLLGPALHAAESAKEHAARFCKAELATLRLGLLPSLSPTLITGALAEIVRRIPAIEVEVRSAGQARLTEDLLQGNLDAALMVTSPHLPERLDSWRVFREGYRVAFLPDHRFALLDVIPAESLACEILLGRADCGAIGAVRERCASLTTALNVQHHGDTEDQLQHLAAAGLGLLLIPQHVKLLPSLVARPLADPPMREIALHAVAGRRRSPALDTFVRLIRARDFAPLLAAA